MVREWELHWEGELPAAPQDVWDAITRHAEGWLWRIDYEPWVGGAERGLTAAGGTVTVWEPPRHFATRTRPETERDGINELHFELEPLGPVTYLRVLHRAAVPAEEFDVQLAACREHSAFYHHSLGLYACHFAGRAPTAYVSADGPEASPEGGFAAACRALGLPGDAVVGDRVHLTPDGLDPIDGVVDYRTDAFLGVRGADALYRVYGRDKWGWPVGIAHHLFAPGADPVASQEGWSAWLAGVLATEEVA